MRVKLNKISMIIFNIAAVLFGLIMLVSAVAAEREAFITDQLFGGYKTDIIHGEDEGDTQYYKSIYKNVAQVKASNNNIAIAAQSEGSVLLKNDNGALPLSDGAKVSLFSVTSVNPIYGIGGSGKVSIAGDEKLSFKQVFEEAGLQVNSALWNWYKSHTEYWRVDGKKNGELATIGEAPWNVIDSAAKADKNYGDAAIFVLGRWGNESVDLQARGGGADGDFTNGDYLQLSPNEISVLKGLKAEKDKGTFSKIIVIINSASPVSTKFLKDDKTYGIDAALWMGLPGTAGLYAVGDILLGDVTPSGRLADTWYSDKSFNPVMANFGDFKHKYSYVVYQEGIYLGYRYTETRYEDYVMGTENTGNYNWSETVGYPFGYGLSYTQFAYNNLKVNYDDRADEYVVSVTVRNIGEYPGKEVVQIYLQQPYTEYDKEHNIEKPFAELVGFAKTAKLGKGEEETVTVRVDGKYSASFDAYGSGTYYLDAGDYYITAAKDAHDAANNILAAKGYTPQNTDNKMDAAGNAGLVYKTTVKEASASKYRHASNTGNEVKTLFAEADINRLDDGVNSVRYITRSNWAETVKLAYDENGTYTDMHSSIAISDKIQAGHNIDADKGVKPESGEYPVYGKDSGLKLIDMRVDADDKEIAYDNPMWDIFLDQLTWDETVALLSNGYRQTVALDRLSKPVTIDQNGSNGYNERFNIGSKGLATLTDDPDKAMYPTGYPCEGIIASTFNTKLAQTVGNAIGEDSLWSGQAGLYGLGLNIHRSNYHGRYAEYYSEDGFLTGVIAGYESFGIQEKGAYVYNKHFVLNEQETNRTSYESWINEQALRHIYLRAFEVSIEIGNSKNVMTAFNRIGSVWTGNSYNLCTAFLRGEAGMPGFAVTDWRMTSYMGMAGGVLAGNDLPDGEYNDFDKYKTGYANVANAMRESAHRILYTVVHSNAMNGIGSNTRIVTYTPDWVIAVNSVKITAIVVFSLSAVFLVVTSVVVILQNRKKSK